MNQPPSQFFDDLGIGPLGLSGNRAAGELETSPVDAGSQSTVARTGVGPDRSAGPDSDGGIEVCYLINHLAPDGAPTVIESLVTEISAEDISFTVCFFGGDDSLQQSLEAHGARVVDFGATTDYPQFDPRSLPSMAAFFASESFDILHCHLPYAQSVGRLVGRLADVDCVISTQHNVPSNYHPIERVAERMTRGLDTRTVAVSKGVESAFTNGEPTVPNDGEKWCTIRNGIDVTAFADRVADADPGTVYERWGIDESEQLFVNIARYQPQKAQHNLIDAMNRVVEDDPSAHLLVVGWGPLESDLKTAVNQNGLSDSVSITGRVPEIYPYYAAADAFVLSSTFEGLPVTLLEAMSAKCPVVATDIPGVREVVLDGETGRLVPPDAVRPLAEALSGFIEEAVQHQYGSNGFDRVRTEFSVEMMATDHRELYRSLVGR